MASFYPTKIAKKGDVKLDLAFVMDCTSSMDPYIVEARDNIVKIVNEIVESENCDVNLALIEFRDHPPVEESFVTKLHDFTESAGTMKTWLRESYACGGGDIPEAVADALNDVLKLSWREGSTKICVVITDAPPHGLGAYQDKFPEGCPLGLDPMEIARALAAKGIGIYVAGCEPSIKAYKDFYLAVAHITGGQYVPLEESSCLVKIIIFGAREEMSLKKFEQEVEKEISELKSSKLAINEEDVTKLLHKRWAKRGETAKQLTLNERGLATAKSSATAMDITKMGFDAVKTLYKTTTPKMRKAKGPADNQNEDNTAQIDDRDIQSKITMATEALTGLQTEKTTKTSVKVDLSGIVGDNDISPASSGHIKAKPTLVNDSNNASMRSKVGGFACLDGAVTLNQTMRLVQKSMIKMATADSE